MKKSSWINPREILVLQLVAASMATSVAGAFSREPVLIEASLRLFTSALFLYKLWKGPELALRTAVVVFLLLITPFVAEMDWVVFAGISLAFAVLLVVLEFENSFSSLNVMLLVGWLLLQVSIACHSSYVHGNAHLWIMFIFIVLLFPALVYVLSRSRVTGRGQEMRRL